MQRKILRKAAVRDRTGLSNTTIWRKDKDENDEFPKSVQVSVGLVGWYEDEIDQWVNNRARGGGKCPPLADRKARGASDPEAGAYRHNRLRNGRLDGEG